MLQSKPTVQQAEESEGFIEIIRFLVKLVYKTYIFCSIYSPFLLIAFVLIISKDQTGVLKIPSFNTTHFSHALYLSTVSNFSKISGNQVCYILLLTYLLLCLLYLMKGMMILLKSQNRTQWKFILVVCSLFTCIIPAWIAQLLIYCILTQLAPSGQGIFILSWILSSLPAYMIYRKHHFKLDSCPKQVVWAYTLGFNILRKFIKAGRVVQAIPAR